MGRDAGPWRFTWPKPIYLAARLLHRTDGPARSVCDVRQALCRTALARRQPATGLADDPPGRRPLAERAAPRRMRHRAISRQRRRVTGAPAVAGALPGGARAGGAALRHHHGRLARARCKWRGAAADLWRPLATSGDLWRPAGGDGGRVGWTPAATAR